MEVKQIYLLRVGKNIFLQKEFNILKYKKIIYPFIVSRQIIPETVFLCSGRNPIPAFASMMPVHNISDINTQNRK